VRFSGIGCLGVWAFAGALAAQQAGPPAAARDSAAALIARAASTDDVAEASALLRRAEEVGARSSDGCEAALALARLEFAQGRPEPGLAALQRADGWPRSDSQQPEWLFWRGQCREGLKDWRAAGDDYRRLLALWPASPRKEAAELAAADCDAALGRDDRAVVGYLRVSGQKGRYAAQALWGLAGVRQRQGRPAETKLLWGRIVAEYPASFEAVWAKERLEGGPPKEAAVGERWWVQVGAYSRSASAEDLAEALRRRGYSLDVRPREMEGRSLYLVRVGPYDGRAAAAKSAARLHEKEKLPANLVEE